MTRPAYRYGDVDMFNVDMVAVEFVCNGTSLPLNRDEMTVGARLMVGKCSSTEMARRCRTDDRTILRILRGLGAKQCPECRQLVFIADAFISRHIDFRWGDLCELSERVLHTARSVAS